MKSFISRDLLQIDRAFKRQKSKGTMVDNLDRNGLFCSLKFVCNLDIPEAIDKQLRHSLAKNIIEVFAGVIFFFAYCMLNTTIFASRGVTWRKASYVMKKL